MSARRRNVKHWYPSIFVISLAILMKLQDEFVPSRRKGGARRFRIHRSTELQQYGFTDACLGCEAAMKGLKAAGHTEECRSRIEAKLLDDKAAAARLRRARGEERRQVAPPPERPKRVSRAARLASASGKKRLRGVRSASGQAKSAPPRPELVK